MSKVKITDEWLEGYLVRQAKRQLKASTTSSYKSNGAGVMPSLLSAPVVGPRPPQPWQESGPCKVLMKDGVMLAEPEVLPQRDPVKDLKAGVPKPPAPPEEPLIPATPSPPVFRSTTPLTTRGQRAKDLADAGRCVNCAAERDGPNKRYCLACNEKRKLIYAKRVLRGLALTPPSSSSTRSPDDPASES